MEGTSCGKDCCFVKSGFCEDERSCPNYTESMWESIKEGDVKVVKDCAPKRTMLEQRNMISRFLAVQSTVEHLGNRIARLEDLLIQLVGESKTYLKEIEQEKESKQLEQKD